MGLEPTTSNMYTYTYTLHIHIHVQIQLDIHTHTRFKIACPVCNRCDNYVGLKKIFEWNENIFYVDQIASVVTICAFRSQWNMWLRLGVPRWWVFGGGMFIHGTASIIQSVQSGNPQTDWALAWDTRHGILLWYPGDLTIEFILGNRKIHSHFLMFPNPEMVQLVEILFCRS